MSRPQIIEAAIVQKVRYASRDEMYRTNSRKKLHGQDIVYKRIENQPDGSVIAWIMFPYNRAPLLGSSLGMNHNGERSKWLKAISAACGFQMKSWR